MRGFRSYFKRVIEPIKFYTEASGLRKVFACEFPINQCPEVF